MRPSREPIIYEINTWVWLNELGREQGKSVTLASVPDADWDAIAARGFDAVWLMGVWERSPAGIAVANRNPGLVQSFRQALPDFRPEDNVGSPYCVRRYEVDTHLGGRDGLAAARRKLAARGMRLILDFVPNHLAPDHPWVAEHPDYFVQGTAAESAGDPASFLTIGGRVFACGRDPCFPAWPDVLQLNAFSPKLRRATAATLLDIAAQCDGVRCDMAMLVLNSVFERTWSTRAGNRPGSDYWATIIPQIKLQRPEFIFVAEAYWDLEWELQQQGFDFCYDKRLYDRLEKETAESVRLHLLADMGYQEKLVRFIENHDEPRALAAFSPPKNRAAAVAMATLPGAKLFHEGQLEGRTVRTPVFLGRRQPEPTDPDLLAFYRTLLNTACRKELRNGSWRLCEQAGWPGNESCRNLLSWCWRCEGEYHLIIVNLSDAVAQGQVRLPWDEISGTSWQMTDLFTGHRYERSGDEMRNPGLYVDLPPWGYHVMGRWLSME